MAKRIFILEGHPGEQSLSAGFCARYAQAARDAGHEVRVACLSALEFDMDFGGGGYANPKPLEPVLQDVLDNLRWCEHLVLAAPMWWGALPAKLKGLIDRILLPGSSFDTRNTKMGLPTPMLSGRTARVILTADTPRWFLRLAYGSAMIRNLRGQVLKFIGFKPARFTYFATAGTASEQKIAGWMDKVAALGGRGV